MPIRFSATVDGLPAFDRAFLKVESALADFRPIWDEVADHWYYPMMEDQFHSAGAAGGTPWQPLSAAYEEWKGKHFNFMPMLRLHDDLYPSFVRKGAKGNIDRRERDFAEWGSSDPKARWHHEGVQGRNLPSRQILVVNDARRRSLQKTIQRGLVKEMRETGLVQRTLEL